MSKCFTKFEGQRSKRAQFGFGTCHDFGDEGKKRRHSQNEHALPHLAVVFSFMLSGVS